MKKKNLNHKLIVSLMVVFLLTSLFANFSFAYIEDTTWGIKNPFPSGQIFYDSKGAAKAIYTYYNQLNFQFTSNPSPYVKPEKTIVYIRKASDIYSSDYGPSQKVNMEFWGTASGSSVGGVQSSGTYCRFYLPGEGKYAVTVYAKNSSGTNLYTQKFNVVYSPNVFYNGTKVVHEVTANTALFTANKGGKITVNATVHDVNGYGFTAQDIKIGLGYVPWMVASRGYASLNWASDIKVTRSDVNEYEYYVTGTVSADNYFNNISGEYYIDVRTKDRNGKWNIWNWMIPHFNI